GEGEGREDLRSEGTEMKPIIALVILAATSVGMQPLFTGATESKWTVTSAGKPTGTITLLTSPNASRAEWKKDAKSPAAYYIATRSSFGTSNADATNYAVRPKKGSASRLAALSVSLLGPSDASVSAGAAGRGAGEKGLKLKDGGDYDAVLKLENRDAKWHAKL